MVVGSGTPFGGGAPVPPKVRSSIVNPAVPPTMETNLMSALGRWTPTKFPAFPVKLSNDPPLLSKAVKVTFPSDGLSQTPTRFCRVLIKTISTKLSMSRFVVLISRLPTTVDGERASVAVGTVSRAVGVPGLPVGLLKLPPPLWNTTAQLYPGSTGHLRGHSGCCLGHSHSWY